MRETPRETDPAVVLASHDSGLSLSECAKKHGVPRGTIGRWLKERRDGKVQPIRPLAIVPAPPLPTPPIRARERVAVAVGEALGPEIKNDLRESVRHLTRHIARQAKAAAEGQPDDWEGDEWRPPSMIELAAAARALDALLSKAGDLLAFDRTTTTEAPTEVPDVATEEGRAAVVERLRKLPRSLREGIG